MVQESLTNVLRHAPGAATRVSLRTGAGRVILVVENAPVATSRPAVSVSEGLRHGGFGLIGMRDRVARLGGTFTAGPTAEGGWRVTTELPCVPQ